MPFLRTICSSYVWMLRNQKILLPFSKASTLTFSFIIHGLPTHETGVTVEALDDSNASYIERSNKMGAPKVARCGRRRKTTADKKSISRPSARHMSCKVGKFDLTDIEWTNKIPECPVYHPSEQEFENPFVYLQKIAPKASKYGICKIVSPITASIPASVVLTKEKKDFKFETIVQPLRLSEWNEKDKVTFSMRGRKYTYHEFEALANEAFLSRFYSSEGLSSSYAEKEFWREMEHGKKGTVEYGVNVEGSAFSCDPYDRLGKSKWNLKNFSRLLQSTLRLVDKEIPGVTDPMLYIGMLFSMFAWHVEDHYLYSINYHHSGANKTWYGVPGDAASQFEKIVLHHVHCNKILSKHGEDGAFQLLAHKTTMFPPNILLQHDVAVYKAVQKPGEFVITFPRAYHAGFSHGFNCGEAVNFAIGDWFPLGAAASKRYAHLRMLPIIPYEELLCKEAMQVCKSSKVRGSENKPKDLASYHATALSFVHLMQFYKKAFLRLNSSRELSSSSSTVGTLICRDCHRDCYVAYMLCEYCCSQPLCLFHDIVSQRCSCGRKYTTFKRDDMLALEDAAKSFEQKKDIQSKIQGTMNFGVNALSLSSIFSYTRNECVQDLQGSVSKQKTRVDSIKLDVEKTNETIMKHYGKRGPLTSIVMGYKRGRRN